VELFNLQKSIELFKKMKWKPQQMEEIGSSIVGGMRGFGFHIENRIKWPMKIQWYNKGSSQIRNKLTAGNTFSFFTPSTEHLLFHNEKLQRQFQLHSEILEANKSLQASARMEVSLPPKSAAQQVEILKSELGLLGQHLFSHYIVSYDAKLWYTYKQLLLHSWYIVARVNNVLYIPPSSDSEEEDRIAQFNLAHFIQQVINQLQSATVLYGAKKKWREHALIPLSEKIFGIPNIIYNFNALPRLAQIFNVADKLPEQSITIYNEQDICLRIKVDSYGVLSKRYFNAEEEEDPDWTSSRKKNLIRTEKEVNRKLKTLTSEMEMIDIEKRKLNNQIRDLYAERRGLEIEVMEFKKQQKMDLEKHLKYLSYAVTQQQEAVRVAKDGNYLVSEFYKRFSAFQRILERDETGAPFKDSTGNTHRSFPEICKDAEHIYQNQHMEDRICAEKMWDIISELKILLSECGSAVFDGMDEIAKTFESRNLHLSLKQHGL
jgi:uncharacterized protein (UPF0335 family)